MFSQSVAPKLILTILLTLPIRGAEARQTRAGMTLQVLDCVAVPVNVFEAAKDTVTVVFEKIEVQTEWVLTQKPTKCAIDPLLPSSNFALQIAIVRRFTSGSLDRDQSVMGVALRDRPLAYIFYENVTSVVDHTRWSSMEMALSTPSAHLAQLLANTMLHEIGHLLLPLQKGHSLGGIMAGTSSIREHTELYRSRIGQPTFTSEEAELIREKLKKESKRIK